MLTLYISLDISLEKVNIDFIKNIPKKATVNSQKTWPSAEGKLIRTAGFASNRSRKCRKRKAHCSDGHKEQCSFS